MKIIVPHRRGIMGTVIFHLLLGILLLGMEIRKMEVHAEMEIVMEAPDPEEIRQQEEEQLRKEEIRQKSSAEEVDRLLRSIAVNENVEKKQTELSASVEEYVDEIMQELQENVMCVFILQLIGTEEKILEAEKQIDENGVIRERVEAI